MIQPQTFDTRYLDCLLGKCRVRRLLHLIGIGAAGAAAEVFNESRSATSSL